MPLTPPFHATLFPDHYSREEQRNTAKFPIEDFLFPASYCDIRGTTHLVLKGADDKITRFLQYDLSVEKLTSIHEHLWLAGRAGPPAALNYHAFAKREFVLDERIQQVYCERRKLYQDAVGFLSSYIGLIRRESDFIIAQEHHLLPSYLSWETWVDFVQQFLVSGMYTHDGINSRYRYGVLKLGRLDWIYKIKRRHVFARYQHVQNETFSELLQAYLALISAIAIYFALVLTAMQVGLATDKLNRNIFFQRASYGFAILSIVAPLALLLRFAVSSLLRSFLFFCQYTLYPLHHAGFLAV
ncbi:hypothetical protein N7488_012211 [Penicillium malachiteum]|nr:hypothetical protein N7488_012211 [Penicillium malachiteum]